MFCVSCCSRVTIYPPKKTTIPLFNVFLLHVKQECLNSTDAHRCAAKLLHTRARTHTPTHIYTHTYRDVRNCASLYPRPRLPAGVGDKIQHFWQRAWITSWITGFNAKIGDLYRSERSNHRATGHMWTDKKGADSPCGALRMRSAPKFFYGFPFWRSFFVIYLVRIGSFCRR